MSSGGGRFDLRFDFFGPPVVAAADVFALGDGAAAPAPRRLAILDGVSTALSGGCCCPSACLNVAESELERGGGAFGLRGDGLIVDENGTYIAEGGRPVGVDVRSERGESDEDEPYESSEGGDAGVTVAEIQADWRILADLFAVSGVFLDVVGGRAESIGFAFSFPCPC